MHCDSDRKHCDTDRKAIPSRTSKGVSST